MKQQNYIDWAQSKINKWIDVDGVYGAQCVDLVMAYMREFSGFTPHGNAIDYLNNQIPEGWTRYTRHDGMTPQAGDVAVWRFSPSDPFGHVGVITAVNGNQITSVEQNVDGAPVGVGGYARVRTRSDACLLAVIRPPYEEEPETPAFQLVKSRGVVVPNKALRVYDYPSTSAKVVRMAETGKALGYLYYTVNEGGFWLKLVDLRGRDFFLRIADMVDGRAQNFEARLVLGAFK